MRRSRGGRELWGFPKKLALPKISHEGEVIVGTLHYGQALCALGTFGYKHRAAAKDAVLKSLRQPNFLLKVIPHVDGTPRICELVRYHLEDIVLKEAWNTPAELQLFRHVIATVRAAAGARDRVGTAPGRGPHAGAWPGRL